MGLNEIYGAVRSQVLMIDPLLYSIVIKEENLRGVALGVIIIKKILHFCQEETMVSILKGKLINLA